MYFYSEAYLLAALPAKHSKYPSILLLRYMVLAKTFCTNNSRKPSKCARQILGFRLTSEMSSSGCMSFTVNPELDSGFLIVGALARRLDAVAPANAGNMARAPVGGVALLPLKCDDVGLKSGPTGAELDPT